MLTSFPRCFHQQPKANTAPDRFKNGNAMTEKNLVKEQAKIDRAMKAVLGMGPVPKDVEKVEPSLKDKDRRYRLQTRKGKTKLVEVE